MPGSPSVALLTRRLVERRVFHAAQYELEDVVADLADVRLVAPSRRPSGPAARLAHRGANRALTRLGRPVRDNALAPGEAVDADLFFGVFANPYELSLLPVVREQIERSTRRVAFVVELYEPGLGAVRGHLPALRGFDHIFVFSRGVLEPLQDATGVPCSFLPTGVDALRFVPAVPPPPRAIDVASFGRRHALTHATLLRAMAETGLHYQFDTAGKSFEVTSHADHRINLAATLQRSRYSVIYKINDDADRLALTGGEETLTSRYYEATAAGAVVLGSRPSTPDFDEQFPWPDAVVPVRREDCDILDVMAELEDDPDRVARARHAGMTAALLRHDWAYRWEHVLTTLGLATGPRLQARKAVLAEHAALLGESADLVEPGPQSAR